MKIIISLAIILSSLIANAQSYSGPESAEFDYAHNRWLIANTQSHVVLARDSAGNLTVFADSLPSGPYGIEIVGDTLFCCSGNSIKGFLLSDASPVFNVATGATFLNGITHDNSGFLYATDFSAKSIYKIDIAGQSATMIASSLVQSPNGIIFDEVNNRCVFVNWGSNAPIKAIDLTNYAVSTIITTTLGSCDGVARSGNGSYFVSNWLNNTVVRFDSDFVAPPVTVATGLSNPADIFYNVVDDTLAIPNSGNNTVTFVGFSTVSISEFEEVIVSQLFPNPAHNFIMLELNKEQYSFDVVISDLTGKIIPINKIENHSKNIFVDISELKAGIYLLKLISEDKKIKNVKFIKAE